jgi:surface antigen-like variable number repeat protein
VIALALAGALLLSSPPADSYDGLFALGLARGHEGRFEDAGRAFDAAIEKDPSRPEAWAERGGLRFLEKRYPEAARDLEIALRLREDAYTRDLLASALHLAGRSDEGLAVWNRLGRPVAGDVQISGLDHTLDRVARREVAVAGGDVLTLARVRETRRRLSEIGVFEGVTVRPVPRGDGRADLAVALVERHGFYQGPVDLAVDLGTNLLFERVRPRYSNIAGRGISIGGQYRWEENRPDLSLQVEWPRPLGLGANLRVTAARGQQLYDLGEPLRGRSHGVDVSLRRVLGPGTVGQLVLRAHDRSFSRPDPDARPGDVVGLEAGLDRTLLETYRHRLDTGIRLFHAGRGLGSDVVFSRATAHASYRAFLLPPEGSLIERSVLAARLSWGRGGNGTPIDEMFAPGGSPEMELPLRAHPQTLDGTLGVSPLGRGLTLTNLEWRRRVFRSALAQAAVVVFYDGAWVSRMPGSGGRASLHDVGAGLRIGLGGVSILRLDYGHGLSDGENAFFFGVNQVF